MSNLSFKSFVKIFETHHTLINDMWNTKKTSVKILDTWLCRNIRKNY